MVKTSLEKLNDKQLSYLQTVSFLISRAREKGLKEEYERNSGKLRGYLECLHNMKVITDNNLKSLYLWFFEKDRSEVN